jgi:hypothetical protein
MDACKAYPMIYKFRSKAAADLIMTGPVGDRVLVLMGKTPGPRGIVEVADMAQAIHALEAAASAERPGAPAGEDGGRGEAGADRVSLRQRVWPMVEMLKRAQAAGEPVVWGV